jgi:hypothetical protein
VTGVVVVVVANGGSNHDDYHRCEWVGARRRGRRGGEGRGGRRPGEWTGGESVCRGVSLYAPLPPWQLALAVAVI